MKKLLLVDDNRDFLQILSIALEKDFEVYKADGQSRKLEELVPGIRLIESEQHKEIADRITTFVPQ